MVTVNLRLSDREAQLLALEADLLNVSKSSILRARFYGNDPLLADRNARRRQSMGGKKSRKNKEAA